MSQRTERYKRCPTCTTGQVRTDEIGKQYASKVNGKRVCPNCKLNHIMAGFGNKPNMRNNV